jgi:hypothetical protein
MVISGLQMPDTRYRMLDTRYWINFQITNSKIQNKIQNPKLKTQNSLRTLYNNKITDTRYWIYEVF